MNNKKISGGKREYRKYREGLFIPHRYVLYVYWYQFLKIAHQENRKINWKKYEEWGTPEELFSQSFRKWWEKNWKRLFSEQTPDGRTGKFIMSSERTKPDAIKTALEVYKNKDKENWDIVIYLQKKYPNKMMSITGQGATETKEVNRTMKRYRKQSEDILQNVCECQFP